MVDTNALQMEFVKRGLKKQDVANILGVSTKTLAIRMKKKVFMSDEIEKLNELLKPKNPVALFFTKNVT